MTFALLSIAAVTLVPSGGAPVLDAEPRAGVHFGMHVAAIEPLAKLRATPDFATYWAGAWIQHSGWGGVDAALEKAVDHGVTPVLQFWYWGDSISPDCVEHGCWGGLHGAPLSKAG